MERQWSRRSASGYSTGLAQTAGVNGPRYTLTTLDGFGDSRGTRDRERRKPAGAIVRGYAIRDVLLLADDFVRRFGAKYGKDVRRMSPAARDALRAHSWPGNVRELSHVIERAVLWSQGTVLEEAQL